MPLVDVVDDIGRRGVDGSGVCRHEGGDECRDEQTKKSDRDELTHRERQDKLKVDVSPHRVELVGEEDERQHRKARNQHISRYEQDQADESAHLSGFPRCAGRQYTLHVVVRGRSGGTLERAFKKHHHEENAEHREAVLRNCEIRRLHHARPVEAEFPPEPDAVPAIRHHRGQHIRRHLVDGDHPHPDTRDRHDDELKDLRKHDTEHATLYYIERCYSGNEEAPQVDVGLRIGRELPREKGCSKLPDANKAGSEEAKHIENREEDDYEVRELSTASIAKPELDPFRAGHHARSSQPDRQEYHQEYLIEYRPQPWYPDALQPIYEEQIHHPHRTADVKHAGGVRKSQRIPGDAIATEEVIIETSGCAFRNPEADPECQGDVRRDNTEIDWVEIHYSPITLLPAELLCCQADCKMLSNQARRSRS